MNNGQRHLVESISAFKGQLKLVRQCIRLTSGSKVKDPREEGVNQVKLTTELKCNEVYAKMIDAWDLNNTAFMGALPYTFRWGNRYMFVLY